MFCLQAKHRKRRFLPFRKFLVSTSLPILGEEVFLEIRIYEVRKDSYFVLEYRYC